MRVVLAHHLIRKSYHGGTHLDHDFHKVFLGNNILALDDLLKNGGKDAILVELQINTHYQDSIHIELGYTVTD